MIKLEDLRPGMPLVGLEPSSIATIAAVVPIGEGSIQVFYRTPDGATKERLLGREDEANLSIATVERPYELFEKFGLEFKVYSSELDTIAPSGNPLEDFDQLVVRLDQMSRNEELQEKLVNAGWDLVVFDEAHKLAAHYYGSKLEKTGRFRFAERIGAETRHLLLMTATPHNGKEEDFQLFLSLLDSDRFYGKFRDGVHKVDVSDLMRRMVKEELVKFDNTPLFPERKAYTVNYKLSDTEAALYEAVTGYVKTEMGKADLLTGSRKGSVGFALTALQRRLASSPEAIYQSLKRRKERLESRLREEKLGIRGRKALAETLEEVPEDDDDLNAEEQENLEETLVDDATAAQSIYELEAEIEILEGLEEQARGVVASGQDRKWDELSKILRNAPEMRDASGRQRKIIIFSEHRDTLNYLHEKIAGVLGNHEAIVTIHGGTHRDERRKIQAMFRSDPDVRVLVATDAAGEGVNLQNANLMVNYDLPWNPNRPEQRFGRIHRIGQIEVCHLWNLVAKETREGDVYHRLLEKLEVESVALKGRVFDILGEVFEETSLKDPLMLSLSDLLLEQHANLLRQGTVLIDPADDGLEPWLLFLVTHEVESGDGQVLSKRLQFVRVNPDGCHVVDVSADKCGWDLTSHPPALNHKQPEPRHIEVKGRVKGATTITVTRNEMLYAFNQGDKFVLAIVLVNEDNSYEGPYYVRRPFDREPGWGVSSINYNLSDLMGRSEKLHV